ncbi:Rap1a/Tai family immunity protein [Pseudomonas laurylsulfatiphila]|uniref:Rap1a/Tai family immunity protein n=1 Tax=Pseudomonas laurylsulfatiphila TaxID=2011015 RepID=UPI003D1E6D5A
MKALLMAVALVGLLGSGAAMAADQRFDGNELLGQCQQYIKAMDGERSYNHIDAGLCGGFVPGVASTVSFLKNDLKKDAKFCTPIGATNGQLVRIVVKYLSDNPKLLDMDRTRLVWYAFVDAYPCK